MNRTLPIPDPLSARAWLQAGDIRIAYYRLDRLAGTS